MYLDDYVAVTADIIIALWAVVHVFFDYDQIAWQCCKNNTLHVDI